MASQEQGSLNFRPKSQGSKKGAKSPLEDLLEGGMEFFAGGRYVEAMGKFEKALQLNSNHTESLKYLGLSLFYQGKYDAAAKRFQQLLGAQPDNEEILVYCGSAYLAINYYNDAERCYRKTIEVNPKNVKGYIGLGQVLYRKGLYSDSIAILNKGNLQDKDNPEVLYILGEAYNKLDKTDMAVSCFEAVLKRQTNNPKVYYNLGILYDKKAAPDKASLMYRRAKELSAPQPAGRLRFDDKTERNDVFFSRSLTVVGKASSDKEEKKLNKIKYEKFRKKQIGKKPHRVLEEYKDEDRIGTMDLTKASLKINEAIKIIKDKGK